MLPLSHHARFKMESRRISEDEIKLVYLHPEQKIKISDTREIWQNKVQEGTKAFVIRIIIELKPKVSIITVYKSSKVNKYWRLNS